MTAASLGLHLTDWLSNRLPESSVFRLTDRLADVWWHLRRRDRSILQSNLELMYGRSVPVSSAIIREAFRNFGRYLVEFFTIHRMPEPSVQVEGYDNLVRAQERGRGVILLSAHLGNWEVAGVVFRRMGFPVSAVVLPHGDAATNRLFDRQRIRCGIHVIPLGGDAARRSLESLRQGHLLGLLGDWTFGDHGVNLRFCERNISLPRGPVVMSLRSQAPIVPVFLIREGIWRFRLWLEPPIWPTTNGSMKNRVLELTQIYAGILERYVKQFPEQWLLFHPLAKD